LAILALAGWALWQQVPDDRTPAADLVQVQVIDVRRSDDRAAHVLVLREVAGERRLSMVIGEAEALAIATELAGRRPPRPLTHDLLRSAIEALDGRVRRVEVTRLHGGTYFAHLVIERGQRRVEVDARPSDAIAVALRIGAPIYVQRALLEGSGPRPPSATF
jgi:bifunctional DNase/RNase